MFKEPEAQCFRLFYLSLYKEHIYIKKFFPIKLELMFITNRIKSRLDATPPSSIWNLFLMFLYIYVIAAFLSEFMEPVNLELQRYLRYGDAIACVFFLSDTLWRAHKANNSLKFWKIGWIELITCIPNLAPATMPTLYGILRVIRGLRVIRASIEISKYFFGKKRNYALAFISFILIISICVGGLLVLYFESEAKNSTIKDSADAIWWAVTTITTVGYGDTYPVTLEGRILGMLLMFAGISLFGVVSGLLASWFLNLTNEQIDMKNRELNSTISKLEIENRQLKQRIKNLKAKLKE